ncbi:RagB/SusD family nutrient uptake outer membrane protein [Olivibacter sp. CPCC 100613]|uniref:RagB/SusD family nutrient uptake outer membrane protein n=1 Tax=Olivibacter sp. CPCC 100613 TaxID=3079931 RepID=UPI002FF9AA34
MKIYQLYFILLILIGLCGCEKQLEEPVYSQLEPAGFLATEEGVNSLLNAAFAEGYLNGYEGKNRVMLESWSTDIEWETDGGENRIASQVINFTLDASLDWLFGTLWLRPYRAIRNANLLLDNIDNASLVDEDKAVYIAEAKFIRALSYVHLYSWFGPVPLRTSSNDPLSLPKAEDSSLRQFIEEELLAVATVLPPPGSERNYGRPNKGAAMALLCKFYLNTKQWQKAADEAQAVIDLGKYNLYPTYENLFKVENERNSEFILVNPQSPQGAGMNYMNGAFPPGFASDPRTGLTMRSNWANWAAQYRLYDAFYDTFDEADKRKSLILTSYINTEGRTVSLLNSNNTRSFKYWPDANAIGNEHGNDMSEIRYADILLGRAEALNELNGPNQESVDLVNQVRERAGLGAKLLQVGQFPSKDDFRTHLLKERGWEFYSEAGIRREDLIRMDRFIASARERGKANAQNYHRFFPIPQAALDADPDLVQNEGY